MSRIISKKHQGKEIIIGELSVKKSHNARNKYEMVTVFKVYHAGPGSEEDLFIFSFNSLLKDWILQVDKSFICIDINSNHKLLEDIYSKIKPSEVINIQEFTDLIFEHFNIFIEANQQDSTIREQSASSSISFLRKFNSWLKSGFRRFISLF